VANHVYDRTYNQALLEARFGARYNTLNEGLYTFIDRTFTAVALLAGAGAFINLVAKLPGLTEIAGLAVAATAVIQALMHPGARAVEHRELARRFNLLLARAAKLDVTALDREIHEIRAGARDGFDSLNPVAQNEVLRNAGYTHQVPMRRWHKVLAFFT
jgi:hypothetical protein